MRMLLIAPVASLLLGCITPEEGPVNSSERAATAITSLAALEGEYRVAGIDGAELGGMEGIAASITGTRLSFEPTCAGFVWEIAMVDGGMQTARPGSRGPRLTATITPPTCRIAISRQQRQLAEALDAVTRAERMPSNAVRLSGEGHSVTLFSQ